MSDSSDDRQFREPAEGWVRDQLQAIDAAGDTSAAQVMDRPIAVFEIEGAKSGLWRRVPLMRVEHDGVWAAVASKGGAPEHPAWYASIQANPRVRVQDGSDFTWTRAREISGAERDQWWERCVAAYPPYAEYQTKTDRLIPVLLCEPV
jgi:F420H(2)-dependent quinone reductase